MSLRKKNSIFIEVFFFGGGGGCAYFKENIGKYRQPVPA
jgi:hypothetical protein